MCLYLFQIKREGVWAWCDEDLGDGPCAGDKYQSFQRPYFGEALLTASSYPHHLLFHALFQALSHFHMSSITSTTLTDL